MFLTSLIWLIFFQIFIISRSTEIKSNQIKSNVNKIYLPADIVFLFYLFYFILFFIFFYVYENTVLETEFRL